MKIAVLSGICVKNDGISQAVRREIDWLTATGEHEVKLYAYTCEYEKLYAEKVRTVSDVVSDGFFRSSDIVVFHFGIYYSFFSAVLLVPRGIPKVVVFHNVTPRELWRDVNSDILNKSLAQMNLMRFADHVICDSEINKRDALEAGVLKEISIVPPAIALRGMAPDTKDSARDGILRISFLGRFVQSKGPCEVLYVVEEILGRMADVIVRLDMMGNTNLSDSEVLRKVKSQGELLLKRFRGRIQFCVHESVEDVVKEDILRKSDVFILPTRHEGFGITVLEALATGNRVVSYRNSNVSAISGELANLVETGSVNDLVIAAIQECDRVRSVRWRESGYKDFVAQIEQHLGIFEEERVRREYCGALNKAMGRPWLPSKQSVGEGTQ